MAYLKTDYEYCGLEKLSSLFESLLTFMKKTPGRDFSGINLLISKIKEEIRKANELVREVKPQEVKDAIQRVDVKRKEMKLKQVRKKGVQNSKKDKVESDFKVAAVEELICKKTKKECQGQNNPRKTLKREKPKQNVISRGQLQTTSMKVDTALQLTKFKEAVRYKEKEIRTLHGKIQTLEETLARTNFELDEKKTKFESLENNSLQLRENDEMKIESLETELQLCSARLEEVIRRNLSHEYFAQKLCKEETQLNCENEQLKRKIIVQNEKIQIQENAIQFIKNANTLQLSEKNKQITCLDDKLKDNDRQINEQSVELHRASKTLHETKAELYETMNSLDYTKNIIVSRDRKIQILEEKLDKLSKENEYSVATMKKNLKEVFKQKKNLEQQLKNWQAKETNLVGIISTLEEKKHRLLLEIGGLENILENANTELKTKNDKLCKEFEEERRNDIYETSHKLQHALEKKETEMRGSLLSLEEKLKCLDSRIKDQENQLRQLEDLIRNQNSDLTQLKTRNAYLENAFHENEKFLCENKVQLVEKLASLQQDNKVKDHQISERDHIISKLKEIKAAEVREISSRELLQNKDEYWKTIRSLEHKNQSLMENLQDRDLQLKNLEELLTKSDETKLKYEKNNQEKDGEITELRNRMKNTSKLLNDKTLRLDQLTKRTEVLEEKEQEYIYILGEKNNELQQAARNLLETKSKSDEEIKLLKTKTEALETDIMHRDSNLNDLKETIDKEKKKCNAKNDHNVVAMNEKDNMLSETVSKLQKQERELKESFAKTIQERDNQISELRSRLSQALEKIKNNEEAVEGYTSLKKECKRLETELIQYKQNIEHLQEMIKTKTDAIAEIHDSKRHLEKDLKGRFNHQRDQMQQKIENLQRGIENRDLQLTNLEERLTKYDETNSKYAKQNQEKDDEITELRNRSKNTSKILDDKTLKIDELTKRTEEFKEKEQEYIYVLHSKNNELQQATQKLQETKSKSDEVIQLLNTNTETEIQRRDDQISELRSKLSQALETIKHNEEAVQGYTSLKKECKRLDAELIQYKQNIEHLQKEMIKTKTDALAETIDSNRHLEKDLKGQFNHQRAQMQQKMENLQRDIENRDLKIKALEKRSRGKTDTEAGDQGDYKRQTEKKVSELKAELQRTLSKLQTTETELDETKTRLSKAMGERLTDNNPNITDLSDRNRPTKLAERCAELYDNQWTDAFDILDKHFNTERDVINALLQILQDAYSFCKSTADEQMTRIAGELVLERQQRQHEDGDVSTDVHSLKQLKDCRKVIANVAVGNLFKMYVSHHKRSTDEIFRTAIIELIPYSKECLEMCWFMVIQDPPVVFAPLLSRGSQFNTDMFRPYTTSGTHLEYVVWPPLLLHDGGPLLAKGVAQGYGKKSKMSTYT